MKIMVRFSSILVLVVFVTTSAYSINRHEAFRTAAGTYKIDVRGKLVESADPRQRERIESNGTITVPRGLRDAVLRIRIKGEPIVIRSRVIRRNVRKYAEGRGRNARYVRYRIKVEVPPHVPYIGGMSGTFPILMNLRRNQIRPYGHVSIRRNQQQEYLDVFMRGR